MLIWWSNGWLIFRLKLAMQITGYRATCISMLFAFVLNAWIVIIQTYKNDNHHLDVGSYLFNNSIVVFLIVHCSMMVFPAVSIKNLPVLKKNRIFWRLGRWLELAFIWWLLELLEFFFGALSVYKDHNNVYMPFHATYIMYYVSLIIFSWFCLNLNLISMRWFKINFSPINLKACID